MELTENFTHTDVIGLQSFPIIYINYILATFQKEDLLIPLESTPTRSSLHRRVLIIIRTNKFRGNIHSLHFGVQIN